MASEWNVRRKVFIGSAFIGPAANYVAMVSKATTFRYAARGCISAGCIGSGYFRRRKRTLLLVWGHVGALWQAARNGFRIFGMEGEQFSVRTMPQPKFR